MPVIHLLPLAAARLLVASVGEEISAANVNHLNHHNHNHHLHLNHHKDHLHHHNVPPAGASPMHLLCLVGQTVELERGQSFCFANNYFTLFSFKKWEGKVYLIKKKLFRYFILSREILRKISYEVFVSYSCQVLFFNPHLQITTWYAQLSET